MLLSVLVFPESGIPQLKKENLSGYTHKVLLSDNGENRYA